MPPNLWFELKIIIKSRQNYYFTATFTKVIETVLKWEEPLEKNIEAYLIDLL